MTVSQATLDDFGLLDRAAALGRVLFSRDSDVLAEATRRQRTGQRFAGVVYAHQLRITIRRRVEDLELPANVGNLGDFVNRVEFLPL